MFLAFAMALLSVPAVRRRRSVQRKPWGRWEGWFSVLHGAQAPPCAVKLADFDPKQLDAALRCTRTRGRLAQRRDSTPNL